MIENPLLELHKNDKYKLKEDARSFFHDDWGREVHTLEYWRNNKTVHLNLLEKVDKVYLTFGKKVSENTTTLQGWGNAFGGDIARFDFTVNVCDMSLKEHEETSIPELMDKIQSVLNMHFK